jgi:SAM-dependent methyltransferase
MEHSELQRMRTDRVFTSGPRLHIASPTPLSDYLTGWRLREAMRRVLQELGGQISKEACVLVLCAAEGYEGSVLCDMGFKNVTVSDISPVAVSVALERDPRLKGLVLNAENTALEDGSFDLVVTQDALHHFQRPVQGFTEMLRISRRAVIFLEPHDSLVGRFLGTKWETHDEAKNYVFRWRRKLVGDLAASFFASESFRNLSFSFWHHNVVFTKLCKPFGNGGLAICAVRLLKLLLDTTVPGAGNQFCGLVIKDCRGHSGGFVDNSNFPEDRTRSMSHPHSGRAV